MQISISVWVPSIFSIAHIMRQSRHSTGPLLGWCRCTRWVDADCLQMAAWHRLYWHNPSMMTPSSAFLSNNIRGYSSSPSCHQWTCPWSKCCVHRAPPCGSLGPGWRRRKAHQSRNLSRHLAPRQDGLHLENCTCTTWCLLGDMVIVVWHSAKLSVIINRADSHVRTVKISLDICCAF